METIVSRLRSYLEFRNVSISSAESYIGLSNASLSKPFKNGTTIKTDTLEKFLESFSDINPEWVLTGKDDYKGGYNTGFKAGTKKANSN